MTPEENLKLRNPAAPSFFDDEIKLSEFIFFELDCNNLPNPLKALPISSSEFSIKNLITGATKTVLLSLYQGYIVENTSVNFLMDTINL